MSDSFIPISKPFIGAREKELVLDALDSGWVSSIGKYIDEFEANFARYCGTEYALAVSNGTTGLHLALAALGLQPGDEVIVPDLTFVATANAVAYTGATPVLADIDADTLCIDPASVKSLISERTKAIIPVHLYGHPADMDALTAIAERTASPSSRMPPKPMAPNTRAAGLGPGQMRRFQLLRKQGHYDRRRWHADHRRPGVLSARQAVARPCDESAAAVFSRRARIQLSHHQPAGGTWCCAARTYR